MATEHSREDIGSSGFGRFVPGIAMLASYEGTWFRPDLLADGTSPSD